MADIFISYSGTDKSNVQLLAALLEEQGWSVWWDRQIPAGQRFDTVIETEIANCYCVIVIWTRRSVVSEWVKNEASEASQQGKLVPVMLEEVQLPLAFKRTEAALLMDWKGEADHTEFELLLKSVAATIEKNKEKEKAGADATGMQQAAVRQNVVQQKPSALHIIMAVAGLLIVTTCVYYFNALKSDNSASRKMLYLLLLTLGVAAAMAISGILNSYFAWKGRRSGTKIKMAGPLVGLVLMILGAGYIPDAEKIITIRVFDKNKNPLSQGNVKIYLREYIRSQSIDNMGQAQFAGIPQKGNGENIRIEVSSPGFATRNFDTVLNRSSTLELTLPFTSVVFVYGKVTTAADNPIKDVEINVDGTRYVTNSINNGDYSLRVEEYTLGDEITITTSHPGYEDKTKAIRINGPEIRGVDFVLNPVNNQ